MSWRDRAAAIVENVAATEVQKLNKPVLSVFSVPTRGLPGKLPGDMNGLDMTAMRSAPDADRDQMGGAFDLEEWALGLLRVLEENPARRYACKVDATEDPVRIYLVKRGGWCVILTCPRDRFDPIAFMSMPDFGALH